jgi:intracellular multiplication protein IcmP
MAEQQPDTSLDILWILGSLAVVYFIISFFWGADLLAVHLWVRSLWLQAYMHAWPPAANSHNLQEASFYLKAHQASEWTAPAVSQLSHDLRIFMFLVIGAPLAFFLWRTARSMPGKRFRRRMGAKELVRAQSSDWPWVLPSMRLDLVKEPVDKGPWAMSRNPVEFCRHYRLLSGKAVDEERADKLFSSQLGKLWDGPDRLNGYTKALFACFIAQMCRNKTEARENLRRLVVGMTEGRPDFSFVDPLIKKHYDDERVQKIIKRHAYVVTVMCGVLREARRNGVMPCAFFLWLRPVDRALWYALQGMGRRSYFVEGAGAHAHFLAELVAGHSIARPYIKHATAALVNGLSEIRFD